MLLLGVSIEGALGQTLVAPNPESDLRFGKSSIPLSNGAVITLQEDVLESVDLGWITNTFYDIIGSPQLSVSDLDNAARTKAWLDVHWKRNFQNRAVLSKKANQSNFK